MSGWESQKKVKKFKSREESSLKRDKTNIQKESFIMKNIHDKEKYIPTNKYVTIAQSQNI